MSKITVTRQLDTSGKCCPMPIVETNVAMKTIHSGEVLEIVATDPGTRTDIPSWCERTGNTLVDTDEADGVLHYYVRKS